MSGLEGKFPKRIIDWQCSKLIKEYFESKGDACKCQLLLCLLKGQCKKMMDLFGALDAIET